ncbi:MAG: choice-of-anchor tandem repeat GloVer-containing protein, partial [Candidatus Korobacteraceae bacterium]
MKRSEQIGHGSGGLDLWLTVAATVIATLLVVAAMPAHAQTFTVIHSFNGADGANPFVGLTLDAAGNLYGTTEFGGGHGCNIGDCGTVFKLTHRGSSWVLSLLYAFTGGQDGQFPEARVTFGPDGTLYGTASTGASNDYYGVAYNLRPPTSVCKSVSCPWTETTIFPFDFGTGYYPSGDLIFDASGHMYG